MKINMHATMNVENWTQEFQSTAYAINLQINYPLFFYVLYFSFFFYFEFVLSYSVHRNSMALITKWWKTRKRPLPWQTKLISANNNYSNNACIINSTMWLFFSIRSYTNTPMIIWLSQPSKPKPKSNHMLFRLEHSTPFCAAFEKLITKWIVINWSLDGCPFSLVNRP